MNLRELVAQQKFFFRPQCANSSVYQALEKFNQLDYGSSDAEGSGVVLKLPPAYAPAG
ncbi:MAG: hypothetical protein M3463_19575 [Verrucomicrobiota bacterium]|nr:hypothetical protein [Verrucomicrobiota bacterium]